jgi:NAD(P)-dependent dehydrogenase (short-subunit alcohol dehydrogenase family)
MRFAGRVVLITGAGSGIGAATAARFVAEGAQVVVADIDLAAARATADSLGDAAIAVELDVAREDAWQSALAEITPAVGWPDVLVNNAFTLTVSPIDQLTPADWARQIEVNLGGVYQACHALVPSLRERGGSIINVGSVHSRVGYPGHPAYAAAKGGVVSLTTQLAVEYGPAIRVNAVLPGSILTPAWRAVSDADRAVNAGLTALRRLGEADEVASAIAFLASPDASYITGTTLLVDGGLLAQRGGS